LALPRLDDELLPDELDDPLELAVELPVDVREPEAVDDPDRLLAEPFVYPRRVTLPCRGTSESSSGFTMTTTGGLR
jgi:hypothetical protein